MLYMKQSSQYHQYLCNIFLTWTGSPFGRPNFYGHSATFRNGPGGLGRKHIGGMRDGILSWWENRMWMALVISI